MDAGGGWTTAHSPSNGRDEHLIPGGSRVGMAKQYHQNYPNEPSSGSSTFSPLLARNGWSFWGLSPAAWGGGGWEINPSVSGTVPAVRACQGSSQELNFNITPKGAPFAGVWSSCSPVPPIPLEMEGPRVSQRQLNISKGEVLMSALPSLTPINDFLMTCAYNILHPSHYLAIEDVPRKWNLMIKQYLKYQHSWPN